MLAVAFKRETAEKNLVKSRSTVSLRANKYFVFALFLLSLKTKRVDFPKKL